MSQNPSFRRHAPAAQRNREPILNLLLEVLPPLGSVLEVASGTGEHAVFFAPHLSPRLWIPSDPDPAARASIEAWRAEAPAANLRPPLDLDVHSPVWPVEPGRSHAPAPPVAAVVCINMIHIAPWSACLGLLTGAARLLPEGGILYLYGPYMRGGMHTAPSNAEFDGSLRARNPEWGVRDMDAVAAAARKTELALLRVCPMPANNFSLVFEKRAGERPA